MSSQGMYSQDLGLKAYQQVEDDWHSRIIEWAIGWCMLAEALCNIFTLAFWQPYFCGTLEASYQEWRDRKADVLMRAWQSEAAQAGEES